ncbi:MAG: enoyl-CoA hydratase/isomerase family protein [Acidimicrobiia bacterium]|nr:enoyl-CoA hydratase/isomerase family protein [Acidimicrobiia bacterium]
MERVADKELGRVLRSPFAHEELAERGPFVLIDTESIVPDAAAMSTLATVPVVFAGVEPSPFVDVVAENDDIATELATAVAGRPLASVALVLLLRGSERRSIADGLIAESAVYSVLQAGPEFERWRADHPPTGRASDDENDEPAVKVRRDGHTLVVTLNRPTVHNAFSVAMRDELIEALGVAEADASINVVIEGAGPSFCSGGDLREMGSRPDPATAHVVRLQRSVGRILASMADRAEARLHGACMGAGIELPTFVDKVTAKPDAQIGLPEIELGLIPGAGGTVSIARRIGRHRTALLALTGRTIDAETALSWGLVDAVR